MIPIVNNDLFISVAVVAVCCLFALSVYKRQKNERA